MRKGLCAALCCLILLSCSLTAAAVGEMPESDSYQYSYWQEAVAAPAAYELSAAVSANSLGVSITGITDICSDPEDNLYILDSSGSIIRLNPDYSLAGVYTAFAQEEEELTLNAPEGIYADQSGRLYIADTGNARIVVLDRDLSCVGIIGDPSEEALLDYTYQPSKVCADTQGHVFVISKNETQGILQFSVTGEFIGYLGATRVVPSMTEMFYRLFATRTQLKNMLRSIPTEYNNLTIDDEGFVYGTVSSLNAYTILSDISSGGSQAAPIRRLNAGGDDILIRNGRFPPVGELVFNVLYGSEADYDGASALVDVAVTDNGVYSLLDSKRGRVFTYNSTGDLLYVFGSRGSRTDQLEQPAAITYQGDKIVVADARRNQVQIYTPTEYARNICAAIACYQDGDYEQEQSYWQQVLYTYGGSDMAYVGIGKSYYNQQEYRTAMTYFKKGHSRTYYSKAFKEYRKQLGRRVTPWLLGGAAVLAVLILIYQFLLKKHLRPRRAASPKECGPVRRKIKEILSGFRYGFYICRHPFDGFWDVKYEHRGSIASATLILVLTVVMSILTARCTPYLFNDVNFSKTNILFTATVSILGPVALWCASNWCLTTLMDGKGTLKDIYIFTCYSLYPQLLIGPLLLAFSYMISLDEATFYTLFTLVTQLWVAFLIFCGTLVTHHYTAGKTVLAILLTVLGIAVIAFIGLLTVTLVQQVAEFIKTLGLEISLRM